MGRIRAEGSAVVDAAPEHVYSILADYRGAHAAILPRKYFSDFRVERGGTGAGTLISFNVHVAGTHRARAEVSEPRPGRVLAETDQETGAVTTFTVHPLDGGRRSRVTITTEWERGGIQGFVERLVAPRMLGRLYAEELALLAKYAAEHPPVASV